MGHSTSCKPYEGLFDLSDVGPRSALSYGAEICDTLYELELKRRYPHARLVKDHEYLTHINNLAALCWFLRAEPGDVLYNLWKYVTSARRKLKPDDLSSTAARRIAERLSEEPKEDAMDRVVTEITMAVDKLATLSRVTNTIEEAVRRLIENGEVATDVGYQLAMRSQLGDVAEELLAGAVWSSRMNPERAVCLGKPKALTHATS